MLPQHPRLSPLPRPALAWKAGQVARRHPLPRGLPVYPPAAAAVRAPLLALLAVVGVGFASPQGAVARSAAPPPPDLTGDWVLNVALSQPSPLPAPRSGATGPDAGAARPVDGPIPPEDSVLPDPPARDDVDGPRRTKRRPPSWLFRPERVEALRVVLGESRVLVIVQDARYVDLRTETSARSLELGARSQVSLPTGELADQQVTWRAGRLVVERRVPRGPKWVETYERLPAGDQLRVTMRRSGSADDGLGRIDWQRIFDRDRGAAPGAEAATAVAR